MYRARVQSARSPGEHLAEERAEQPSWLWQAEAEPGEMRRQQTRAA
jgi:hypothetical protein